MSKFTTEEIRNLPFKFIKITKDIFGGMGTNREYSAIYKLDDHTYKYDHRRFTDKSSQENAVYPFDDVCVWSMDLVDDEYNVIENVFYEEKRYNDYT